MLQRRSSHSVFSQAACSYFAPTYVSNQRLFGLYRWSLIGMVVLLIGAILLGRGAENGDAFGSRVEFFLTDPDEESDQKKWQTEVAIRLAGIQSGDQAV